MGGGLRNCNYLHYLQPGPNGHRHQVSFSKLNSSESTESIEFVVLFLVILFFQIIKPSILQIIYNLLNTIFSNSNFPNY